MLDVTKYPPSAHGFTCRNCGGGDRGRVAICRPFGEVSLSLNRTVTCMVLKANDRRTSCPCHDEFVGLVLTTSDSRRAASPLVRLVDGEQRWEALDHSQSVLHLNCGGTELNWTVIRMLLKAAANDRRSSRSPTCLRL
ncbi:uncharacterized protein TNCV_180001 [Trichonephila clavipes]|nr:uncharacterized protein TNCV_180001 [Trichonephila clavipes]